MSNKLNPKELVTFEELLLSNTIQQEAMFNILERKGLISKKELLEEIIKIKKNKV